MSTDPAYMEAEILAKQARDEAIELEYLRNAAQEYADAHPGMSEEEAKDIVWARAGRTL